MHSMADLPTLTTVASRLIEEDVKSAIQEGPT